MIRYNFDVDPRQTWNCTETDCDICEGKYCDKYTLTVSTEGAVSDLSSVSDCRYGDTVKLEKKDGSTLSVMEMVVIGKGKSNVS